MSDIKRREQLAAERDWKKCPHCALSVVHIQRHLNRCPKKPTMVDSETEYPVCGRTFQIDGFENHWNKCRRTKPRSRFVRRIKESDIPADKRQPKPTKDK